MTGSYQMLRLDEIVVTKGMESPSVRVADLCGRCLAGRHSGRPCLNTVAAPPHDHVCRGCVVCEPTKEGAA